MKSKLSTAAMLIAAPIIWGFAFIAQVLGSDHVGSFTFVAFRFLLGAVSLVPVYMIFERESEVPRIERRRRHTHTMLYAIPAGVAMFVASAFQQYGTTLTRDPGKAGFVTGLYTIFTPLLCLILFRKRTAWNTWLGCGLAAVGLYLLCLRPGETASFGKGELFLLLGSFCWAVHIIIVDRFIDRVSPLRFAAWQFVVAGMLGLVSALLFENMTWADIWQAKWALLYCGVLAVGVAYTLQILGQKYADPTFAAIIFSTESVFAALGGLLWNVIAPKHLWVNHEILPIGYVGCFLIFGGIVLSQLTLRLRKRHMNKLDLPHDADPS